MIEGPTYLSKSGYYVPPIVDARDEHTYEGMTFMNVCNLMRSIFFCDIVFFQMGCIDPGFKRIS